MEKEINEIIQKNLPAHLGTILKERLAKAEGDEEALSFRNQEILDLKKKIKELNETLNEYQKLDSKYAQLNEREKQIESRERNQKLFEAEMKAVEADKRASELAGIVGMVFKSPVYRTSYVNQTFGQYDSQGRYNTTGSEPIEKTKSED